MYSTRQVGSLAVVEETVDRKRIEAELRQLDAQLFLDAEVDLHGRFVWTVKVHIGSEYPPVLVFEWRDERGEPMPLTFGIVDRVKRLEGQGHTVVKEISEHNQALRAKRDEESMETYEEIWDDFEPRMSPVHGALLPRGVGLRVSRDKARARGEKI